MIKLLLSFFRKKKTKTSPAQVLAEKHQSDVIIIPEKEIITLQRVFKKEIARAGYNPIDLRYVVYFKDGSEMQTNAAMISLLLEDGTKV